MNKVLVAAIESCLAAATNRPARIVARNALGGGCINSSHVVELENGQRFFVKSNTVANVTDDLFEREAEGLSTLAAVDVIAVPAVIGLGKCAGSIFLVLDFIESDKRPRNFSETFGRQLAELHRHAAGERFGFELSNYIGRTNQPNDWTSEWVLFWRDQRLGFQFDLARKNGYGDAIFNSLADRLLRRLEDWLTVDETPVLIHGDLWSGNYLVGKMGEPVLIDPAVYYGHREAEFGMTTLFGGFEESFYQAYRDVWPLDAGSSERIELYRLYHLLNHLNLFGRSYRNDCLEIMKKYV